MADRIVYKHIVTFQEVLDSAPTEVQENFKALSEEEQEDFIEANIANVCRGFEWGLADPNTEVLKTVATNLVFKENNN